MALDNVTFFEVHLGDRSDETESKGSAGEQSGSRSEKQKSQEKQSSGRSVPVKGLVALTVVLAGAAFAAKRMLGGGEDIETEPIEPGVEVERNEA